MTTQLDIELEQSQHFFTRFTQRIFGVVLIAVISVIASLSFTSAAYADEPVGSTADETHAYTVSTGETLSGIARRCHTSVERIVSLNHDRIEDPHWIYPGQRFRLEQHAVWKVKQDETLTQVSACTGKSIKAIAKRNSISDPHWIDVGQRLELAAPGRKPTGDAPAGKGTGRGPSAGDPATPPPAQDPGPKAEKPSAPVTPAPSVASPHSGKSTTPWLIGAIVLAAFAFLLFAAAPLRRAIVRRVAGGSTSPADRAPELFVALASRSNDKPLDKVAIDVRLFERIVTAAAAVEGIGSVGRVRLWRHGDAVACLAPVEIDRPRNPTKVARSCANAVVAAVPELGEVTVGYELRDGPGDGQSWWEDRGSPTGPPPGTGPSGVDEASEPREAGESPDGAAVEADYEVSRLNIAGVPTRVLTFGPADGRPVLCVHGFAAKAELWRKLARRLAEAGYRVFAPDLPGGFGEAPPPPPGAVTPQLDEFLRGVIEELICEPPLLVAHSQGAYVGALLASGDDVPVEGFVALAPAGMDQARWMSMISGRTGGLLFRALLAAMPRPVRRRFLAWGHRATVGRRGAEAFGRRLSKRRACAAEARAGTQFLAEVSSGELRPGAVTVPSLYLWGSEDKTAKPTSALRVLAEAPEAEVRVLPGCGHTVQAEAPEDVAAAILRWARSN